MVLACEQAPLAVTITASPRTLNARAQSANVSLLADYDGLETGHFLDCWIISRNEAASVRRYFSNKKGMIGTRRGRRTHKFS